MASKITYLMVGAQGNRQLTAVCADCGDESPLFADAYAWGNAHREKGCL